jgi:hypothetical protein
MYIFDNKEFHVNISKAIKSIEKSNKNFRDDLRIKQIIDDNISKISKVNKIILELTKMNDNIKMREFVKKELKDLVLNYDNIDTDHIDLSLYYLLRDYFDIFYHQLKQFYKHNQYEITNSSNVKREIETLISIFNSYIKYIIRIKELYKILLLLKNKDNFNLIYNTINLIKELLNKIKDDKNSMNSIEIDLKFIYENNESKYKSSLEYINYEDFIKKLDKFLLSQSKSN